jgi:hypothetical protein
MGDDVHFGLLGTPVSKTSTEQEDLHLPCTLAGPSAVAMMGCTGFTTLVGRQGIRERNERRGKWRREDCLSVDVMCPCLSLTRSILTFASFI